MRALSPSTRITKPVPVPLPPGTLTLMKTVASLTRALAWAGDANPASSPASFNGSSATLETVGAAAGTTSATGVRVGVDGADVS